MQVQQIWLAYIRANLNYGFSKQTNCSKKREWIDDYFMQGAAYALAHNELYETKIESIAIFMCSREGQNCLKLTLKNLQIGKQNGQQGYKNFMN